MSRPLSRSALTHPVVVWEHEETQQAPRRTLSAQHLCWVAWERPEGEGQGRALGGDVRVIDTVQQAVEEAGDASVTPGAGRGVNEWRRCTE